MGLFGIGKYVPNVPNVTASSVLTLDLDVENESSFPLVWAAAVYLYTIWQLRSEKS